jgi:hypothetical protein
MNAIARAPGPARALCHVSDRADEVDVTIAFASRGLDAPAIASATIYWSAEARELPSHRGEHDVVIAVFPAAQAPERNKS